MRSPFIALFLLVASFSYSQADKVVLIEEGTGMWCQPCSGGIVYGWEVHDLFPDDAIFIAIHYSDDLELQEYSDAASHSGIPTADLDRAENTMINWTQVSNDLALI